MLRTPIVHCGREKQWKTGNHPVDRWKLIPFLGADPIWELSRACRCGHPALQHAEDNAALWSRNLMWSRCSRNYFWSLKWLCLWCISIGQSHSYPIVGSHDAHWWPHLTPRQVLQKDWWIQERCTEVAHSTSLLGPRVCCIGLPIHGRHSSLHSVLFMEQHGATLIPLKLAGLISSLIVCVFLGWLLLYLGSLCPI